MKKKIAQIILINQDHKFLIQERTSDAPNYPDKFGFFGGEIETDETPINAIIRECEEELELEITNPEKLLFETIDTSYGIREKHVFLVNIDKMQESKLKLHEGKAMHFVAKEELERLDLVDHDRIILPKVFKHLEKLDIQGKYNG